MRCPLLLRNTFITIPRYVILVIGTFSVTIGQEPAPPATVDVKIGTIQSEVKLDATLAPADPIEISLELKSVASLRVVEAVAQGAMVKEGDVLVRFDTDDITEQIENSERSLASMRLGLEEADREAKLAELQMPLDKEQAEIAKRQADEDFKYFQEFEKAMGEKANEQRLKSTKDNVDYTAEELRQLEKMYKADDLTEESEEIVLRRARDDLARSLFGLEQTELAYRRSKELLLPRSARDQENAHRLAEIAYQRFQLNFPLAHEKRVQAFAKLKRDFEKAVKAHEELKQDLKSCVVHAPKDGVVYYGRVTNGKWSPTAEARAKLKKHGSIGPHDVFMTIVRPNSLEVVGTVPEADVAALRVGAAGRITPNAYKHDRVDIVIKSISNIPVSDGSFDVTLDLGDTKLPLVAGMTGSVKLVTYFNPRGMLIPTKSIFTDESDDQLSHVYVLGADNKVMKKPVQLGIVQGDNTEIRSGIEATDKILADKPKTE
jgi:HlyD family secretion protein